MTLSRGTKLGVYDIVAILGRGGMGEVYRAHDTKLQRDVALKVLPDSFSTNPDRLARFEREARVLAALNHPHIAAIYGLHDSGPTKALVLELVEGPTLADRIAQGPIALDEARPIARQIAQALEAAHDQGIVHRDLKPANIKVRGDGTVKVLDFGLAKALEPPDTDPEHSQSPTITSPALTQMGVLLGTAAYMSPELAKGRPADRRSDIWAFGCVLFEMLSGTRAFDGEHMTEVLGAVVRLEPNWQALPAATPPALQSVLRRCLQKDPALRMRDIADVRFQLEEAFDGPSPADRSVTATPGYTRVAGWSVALLVTIAAAIAWALSDRRPAADPPEVRLEIVTPPAADPVALALSPDGRSLVFQAGQEPPLLWLRSLASQEARPLTGTEGGALPFWSPDSRSIGFFADGLLKRLDLENGFVRTLASAPGPRGGTWHSNGTILIGSGLGPLNSVPANGGPSKSATRLLPEQTDHRWPQFLPGGDRFLLFATGAPEVRGLYLGSLGDANLRRVVDRELAFSFMPPASVLLARQGALWALRLNRQYTAAEDGFVPVAQRVLVHAAFVGYGAFSASSTGSIAFRASNKTTQLAWLDRTGSRAGLVGQPDDSQLSLSQLSSDGRTAVVERKVDGNRDVWLVDMERGVPRRVTFDEGDDGVAILSPDGSRVVHATGGRREFFEIHERRSDGTGGQTLVLGSQDDYKQPQDWTSDGRYILYRILTAEKTDLWALPLFGERKPFEVAASSFTESNGRFSPDGRWVAYESTETGRSEIFVQPFPGPGPKSQISVEGGTFPRWRRNGQELFYLAADGHLTAVPVAADGARLNPAASRSLFRLPAALGPYEPSPDGQRFLVNTVVSEASPITVILNWKAPGS